ncbi:MAG: hypothetical protein Q9191_003215 [Dirinaria sp. TL-2023a]
MGPERSATHSEEEETKTGRSYSDRVYPPDLWSSAATAGFLPDGRSTSKPAPTAARNAPMYRITKGRSARPKKVKGEAQVDLDPLETAPPARSRYRACIRKRRKALTAKLEELGKDIERQKKMLKEAEARKAQSAASAGA